MEEMRCPVARVTSSNPHLIVTTLLNETYPLFREVVEFGAGDTLGQLFVSILCLLDGEGSQKVE